LLKEKHEERGGVVKSEAFSGADSDCQKIIEKLKDLPAIFAVGFPEHFTCIFKTLKKINYRGHILASSDAAVPFVFEAPEANGVYLAAPIIYNPTFILAKDVKESYENKHNMTFDHMAANGYDTLKILSGLIDEEEISRESLKGLLDQGFSSSGVLGTVDVEPGQHDIGFPLRPAQVKDGIIKYR